MATIHEKLVLGDHFSSTLSKYQNMVSRAAGVSDGLTRKIIGIGSAWLSLRGIGQAAGLADTISTTTARLNMMNDGLQSTAELTEMIYDSANRARGAYQDTADMVAKLGTLAGEAFGSSGEIVAFSEQINKLMTLSGASSAGRQAAMLQLTQAMSSGVLRGEELNSILEQTPTIAQTIARYLGVSTGEMRNLASEGLVTAKVVKDAVFSSAEETNTKFAQMPMTFSQAATRIKNAAIMEFQPIGQRLSDALNSDTGQAAINGIIQIIGRLGDAADWTFDRISDGIAWARENSEKLEDVLGTVASTAALAGAAIVASGTASALSWAKANWQMLLVVGAAAGLIYTARQSGATWEEIGEKIGGIFGGIVTAAKNMGVGVQNVMADTGNMIGNMMTGWKTEFEIFGQELLVMVYDFAARAVAPLDKLFTLLNGWTVEDLSTMSGPSKVYNDSARYSQKANEAKAKVDAMRQEKPFVEYYPKWTMEDVAKGVDAGEDIGKRVGAAFDQFNFNDFVTGIAGGINSLSNEISDNFSGELERIAADVSSISKTVSMSDETLKSLVDMAERQYVNNINLTSQTPVINITGANTGHSEADRRALADALRDVLVEQASAGSNSSTAEAY